MRTKRNCRRKVAGKKVRNDSDNQFSTPSTKKTSVIDSKMKCLTEETFQDNLSNKKVNIESNK